jgi:hypothetical protein
MSSRSILGLRREMLPVLPWAFRLPMLGMDSRPRENGDAPRVGVPNAGEPDVERNEGESRKGMLAAPSPGPRPGDAI